MTHSARRRVILESPFAGDIVQNVAYAKRCVRDALERGEAPIASHLLFTQDGVLRDHMQEERKLGIEAGLVWITVADAMVVYVDRGISAGMNEAMKRAQREGCPVELRSIETMEITKKEDDAA